ncbi:hypothetical protein HMPREF1986_00608 [Oribacterium sp. oral taxon 078 str. F0263]|uniref:hypothetical protein n=1 Tax=Oribacterium sp. oral taxon 078 TaxID=652706 RepID=UPI0003ADF41F|nr:hypothetical protein [Oribacterium sp. oral taxon 078]ERL22344.1 hypothetical protein HMPREF1986_00608 [Oribacterium sp. oral taxon 078 str. F0263]
MDLKIDPEFAEKIPPLTKEEYEQLEANILSEGAVLNPIIVWNGVIVDGHNRYRIIQAHPEISYTTHRKEFSDRYEAIAWICRNQLGRRNLTEAQKKYLVGKQYAAEKATIRNRLGVNQYTDEVSGQNVHKPPAEKTSERIAKEIGKNERYVRRSEEFARGLDAAEAAFPGIKHEIFSGTIKPAEKSVAAIARASPEERTQLAEALRKPRPSPGRKKTEPLISTGPPSPTDNEEEPKSERPTSALAISESMASTPERKNRDTPVETIIAELSDALEGMIFRWDFCLNVNQPNASLEECRTQIRSLAAKGIDYLQHIKEDK